MKFVESPSSNCLISYFKYNIKYALVCFYAGIRMNKTCCIQQKYNIYLTKYNIANNIFINYSPIFYSINTIA